MRPLFYKIVSSLLIGLILLFVTVLLSKKNFRLDLTEDQEYTLSPATLKFLSSLEDRVVIRFFVTEKIPSGLSSTVQQIIDMLDEYRIHSKAKLIIETIHPDQSMKIEQEAQILGIPPVQLNVKQKDKVELQKVYLGAVLLYADRKETLPLLGDIQNIEYDLTAALYRLTSSRKPHLGFLWSDLSDETQKKNADLLEKNLEPQGTISHWDIPTFEQEIKLATHNTLDVLLIVAPENLSVPILQDIDSLNHHGTAIVLLINTIKVAPDLSTQEITTGFESWLEKKGIRLSSGFLLDPVAPGRATFVNNGLQYSIPYPFFVKINPNGLNTKNPITSKLESIILPWTQSFFLEKSPEGSSEILASTSPYSFIQEGPPALTPQDLEKIDMLDGQSYPVAILFSPKESQQGKLAIVANSNFALGSFLVDDPGNTLFLQNMTEYLSLGDQLISIRSRGKTDRSLMPLTSTQTSFIRWGNILSIVGFVLIMSFIFSRIRKRKMKKIISLLGQKEPL